MSRVWVISATILEALQALQASQPGNLNIFVKPLSKACHYCVKNEKFPPRNNFFTRVHVFLAVILFGMCIDEEGKGDLRNEQANKRTIDLGGCA
jgi:hypothetical protein